ncbi:hypothetical protein L3X14_10990 [Pseudomonas balearica]|uniref:hypothetical protein n=1 Tax=Stutzerimonas balearica TaxID=74829 RepID=UPI001F3CF591|nr:hypothetical protein [Stutzerimonas balearica]
MLLSRELSLYFKLDLSKIPASKRPQALQQQLLLLSPFANPGHYANWQAGRAQVWIWDQAALLERLPQAARYSVLPDSALSLNSPLLDGERLVAGIKGLEWQRWRDGQLDDSRWAAHHTTELPTHELDLSQRSPLQAADRQLLQNLGMASVATALLAALLIQIGAWLDLSRSQEQLTAQLAELEEGSHLQAQARRRALQSRDRWLTRQALFTHSQSELIARVGEALPPSASLWQRYDYQPGRLQIFLLDPTPDPRDYVRRLDETAMVDSVQVQPEPRNGMVTLQAVPFAHGGEL